MGAARDILGDRRAVAIFGSSEPVPGEPLYDQARDAGRRLAGAGLVVINGGYGGVMEAASRGARDAGGMAIGVTVERFLARSTGNRWLSHEVSEPDLYLRTRSLVEAACGFLVLQGRSGTLAELAFLWALHRACLLRDHPVVLAGKTWQDPLRILREAGIVEGRAAAHTWWAATAGEAVDLLLEKIG